MVRGDQAIHGVLGSSKILSGSDLPNFTGEERIMVLEPVFERFVAHSPLSVMARATIEHALPAFALDELFEHAAQRGYTHELLFSTTVDLMSLVVCGQRPHVKAAYHQLLERVPVTLKSVYEKLQHIETAVSAALVHTVAQRCQTLITELGGTRPGLVPAPYRVKILDGNHLAATQKRLRVTRGHTAGPLPGLSLVVLDAASMLVTDVIPCEDGNANERSLIDRVVSRASADEVWIADRIFSTLDFFEGLTDRRAAFVVRRHGNLNYLPHGEFAPEVETERGWVRERPVRICHAGRPVLAARLVVVRLKEPTEDGDKEVEILTNLPVGVAGAASVSQLYLARWTIEGVFHELTMTLNCELNTLGYPRAALFGFCVAVVAYNVLSVLKASLRVVHGVEKVEKEVSGYYVAQEWSVMYAGMMVAVPGGQWTHFGVMSACELAGCLRAWSARVDLRKFKKSAPRPPTKHQPRIKDRSTHLSTAQLLEQAKQNKRRQH
jgi:IS4 transposase